MIKRLKKIRVSYYEDEDVYEYMMTLPQKYRSTWVRQQTRKQKERDLKAIKK